MVNTLNKQPKDLKQSSQYDVLVIGGGPAGVAAAIYTSRADLGTLVIDKGLTSGALGITNKIVNYPGVIGEVSGAELLERMRVQARSFGTEFATDRVIGVNLHSDIKTVFGNAGIYSGRSVIIATGSLGRGMRVKGEDELLGRGVSYCATCDAAFFRDKEVLVAGNNDEAIEEGLYLTKFAGKVHFLSPTTDLKAPLMLIRELSAHPKVKLYKEAKLLEIVGNAHVEAAKFELKGEPEQTLPIAGAFVYLQGGRPITDYLQGQLEVGETGCLIVDREFKTTVEGVYAVGDVLCNHVKQVVVAAGEGAVAGMAVEKTLRGRKQIKADWAK